MKTNHNHYLKLAFNIAKINLGKTRSNPSVGCVVVKDGSVISSACTSVNGRPHAEFNALNSIKSSSKLSLYVTMEPCTHYGITPPCTNIIKKKKIKNIYFSYNDIDIRTSNKLKSTLKNNKIKITKLNNKNFTDFYESYFTNFYKEIPLIDAKLGLSKDYYTINKKSKWITNSASRSRVHLIRSEYDSIISTSTTINNDNSLLNCRLNGFDNNKPDLIIIDLKLKLKKKLKLLKFQKKRKILIITQLKDRKKISYFKKKNIKFIYVKSLTTKNDFIHLFKKLKLFGYNRILVESGLKFLNKLLIERLISNIYMFKSSNKLGNYGFNNVSSSQIKKIKLTNRINVNLNGDKLFKVKL